MTGATWLKEDSHAEICGKIYEPITEAEAGRGELKFSGIYHRIIVPVELPENTVVIEVQVER
jgi:hypothetical protein